jgi:hypothetical protein
MENTNRDTAQNAAPKTDWRTDETNAWLTETPHTENSEGFVAEPTSYFSEDREEVSIHAMAGIDAPDPDPDDEEEEDDAEEEEDENADWGHIDPAEGNSPFPDSNDPSGPGSAV